MNTSRCYFNHTVTDIRLDTLKFLGLVAVNLQITRFIKGPVKKYGSIQVVRVVRRVGLEVALGADGNRAVIVTPLRGAGTGVGGHTVATIMTCLLTNRSTTIMPFPLSRTSTDIRCRAIGAIRTSLRTYRGRAVGVEPSWATSTGVRSHTCSTVQTRLYALRDIAIRPTVSWLAST